MFLVYSGMISLQGTKKPRLESSSDSGSDEGVVAESQLVLAKQNARHWRQHYQDKCKGNEKMHDIIKAQQACIDQKLRSGKLNFSLLSCGKN